MIRRTRITISAVLFLAGAVLYLPPSAAASAAAASEWVATDIARTRLISAVSGVGRGTKVRFAIQIQLKPEWKTYWRFPGEAGIPPQFDWNGSKNLEDVEIGWPAPSRYASYGLETVGYKNEILFPITATMTEPGRALSINLAMDYAVCRNICVPLAVNLSLRVPKGAATETPFVGKIDQFSARIPKFIPANAGGSAPRLGKLEIENDGETDRLRVNIRGLPGTSGPDMFIDAGDEFSFGSPVVVSGQPAGVVEFLVPIRRYRKNPSLDGTKIRVTVVADGNAYEWRTTLGSD